jgi:3-oxoacyl-[acyl-carrier protein] reductase
MNEKKTAIVTGASGGIGSAVAVKMAKEGYSLVLLGNHSIENLTKTKKACDSYGKNTAALQGDLSSGEKAAALMSQSLDILGHIDCLINCAGISHIGLMTDMQDREWHNIIDSNLSSVFYCCREIVPAMVHEKRGRILNISSVWGNTGASCEVAYSASKGGMNAFTKALAKELAPSGIAVNALACGLIDTAMNQCFSEDERDALCEEIPAGRMGTPEEVADMAALLCKAPYYLTGQIITMDGGWC